MNAEVRCPNCGTSFVIGKGGAPVSELSDGIHFLVPDTVRNNNVTKVNARMEALKTAGVDVDKLQSLMSSNEEFKTIFDADDPILETISKGGFIRNPELFRRWITAQTFALIKDKKGWTSAVRKRYNTRYVFRQTQNELWLQLKLQRKGIKNDRRFTFFTLESMKRIFIELVDYNRYYNKENKESILDEILHTNDLKTLNNVIGKYNWWFTQKQTFFPRTWLNCFKGAGAYYTLQNIIRTHGMILPGCKDMNESLAKVEKVYNDILAYAPYARRWDILLSVLTVAVKETNFELKY